MRLSVVIPAFNCEKTIGPTLDSVFRQSVLPDEILVLNDGSTDSTASCLQAYGSRVTVFEQSNKGLAAARNFLCDRAQGDLIAFLDNDDVWHPRYLETQLKHFEDYPNAAAFFTGHIDFYGYGDYEWADSAYTICYPTELIPPLDFFRRYNKTIGVFSSCSFFCMPRSTLTAISKPPFRVNKVDDFYCFCLIATFGSVVYDSTPLVAYRIRPDSLSSDRLTLYSARLEAVALLEERYRNLPDKRYFGEFQTAFASHQRLFAKYLMGAGKTSEARGVLWKALRKNGNPLSAGKSAALLFLTYLPTQLQPRWPSRFR